MNSIDERADKYAKDRTSNWIDPATNKIVYDKYREEYKEIAEEQKDYDIAYFKQIIHKVVIEELGMGGDLARHISSHIKKAMQ